LTLLHQIDLQYRLCLFPSHDRVGTRFVFDDMKTYEMSKIAYILEHFGFKTSEMGDDKCMLEKTE